ncbi:MAG TPA: PIG-L family deacetylase [Pelolinea sp.]|nr:PIG-L family deacetylase [Pelolinea sp.]
MNNSLSFYGKKVFFIGAHPDDIEIGCGGLISNISHSAELFCITLSDNQKNPLLKDVVAEYYASLSILGVQKDHAILGEFETRRFMHFRQEILEFLINLNKAHRPEIVFVHSKSDLHQDHGVVTDETLRAFRGTSVFGYDVIRSSQGFFPTFLVEISEEDVNIKIESLAAYKTYADKYYFSSELTRAISIRNGALCERKYAEGFDILRIVGKFSKK